jgi:cysteine desulfuration protein SufE
MQSFAEKQQQIIEDLIIFPDWSSWYNYLIELGRTLPKFPEHLKFPANKISTCISNTYIHISYNSGLAEINGTSNASIPAGFIALLKNLCDGYSKTEICNIKIDFHIKSGLYKNLSTVRQSGLNEMILKIINP